MTKSIATHCQLLSNQRGSITLHLTGGKEIGIFDGSDVGKNSPGHRWRASTNNRQIRAPRNKGARIFDNRLLLAFCGQINTSLESPAMKKGCTKFYLTFVYPYKKGSHFIFFIFYFTITHDIARDIQNRRFYDYIDM